MSRENLDRPSRAVDPFEQELQRFLADEAIEPAPERLVTRIASIPGTVRARAARPSGLRRYISAGVGAVSDHRLSLRLTAVAGVAVLLVAGALVLRGFGPTPDLGNSPSIGPVAASPSADAVGPSPTAGSTSISSPSPVASAMGPLGGPVPTDFRAVSATFANADAGWLLGSATCAGAPCAAIVRTLDGGRTWAGIPAPNAVIVAGDAEPPGVSQVRFADARNGWAFGPDLWATHDGGATWHTVTLPEPSAGAHVMTLEASGGVVHSVYFEGNAGGPLLIASSPVDSDAWIASPTTVPMGAGPVPHAQLVLSGSAGWLVEVDRVVVGGARLESGAWIPWQPPCSTAQGPATLAAASPSDLVAACDVGLWSTPTGVHLFVSLDGGATFREPASKVPVSNIEGVAYPAAGTVLVSGGVSNGGSAIVGSFDDGASWIEVQTLPTTESLALSFATDREGFAVATSSDGTSQLFITRDGGRSWSMVPITGG